MNKHLLLIITFFAAWITLAFFSPEKPNTNKASLHPNYKVIDTISKKISNDRTFDDKIISDIKSKFQNAISKRQIVGASIVIVKSDSIVFLDGFGYRNSKMKMPVTPKTVFRLGSMSKGFGGVLMGIYNQKRMIHWNDKIIDYIPSFSLSNPHFTKEITISNILSHTSGLPYHSFTNLIEDGLTINEITDNFIKIKPLQKPGKVYNYQNAIFALGGEIIECITDKPLTTILKEEIFEPLEMHNASASYESLISQKELALPHSRRYGRWKALPINKKYFNAITAGGINASAEDMAKWLKLLMGEYPEILSDQSRQKLFEPVVKVAGSHHFYKRLPGYKSSFYGHGWRLHSYINKYTKKEEKIIHHGGSVNNFRSEIAIYPEKEIGICVLFNNVNSFSAKVIPDILKIIIDADQSKENIDPFIIDYASNLDTFVNFN